MIQRWHPDADGLQVVPDQWGLQVQPDRSGLEVATFEQRPRSYGNLPQKAYGKEEKIWNPQPNTESFPEAVKPLSISEKASRQKIGKRFWTYFGVGSFVLIAIVIGIAVGVSVRPRQSTTAAAVSQSAAVFATSAIPTNTTGTAAATGSPTATIPLRAARKDTGVLAFYPATDNDLVWLYWQDRNNSIRSLTYSYDGVWQNSARLPVDDALNGTAFAGTFYASYTSYGATMWIIVYVDNQGVLQNLLANSKNTTWAKGNLGAAGYKVPTDRRITLSCCWQFQLFGPGDAHGGLVLMAGGQDGLVHEYKYNIVNNTWSEGMVFPGTNGYAGAQPVVAQGTGYQTYLTTVTNSSSPELEFWWQDMGNSSAWVDGEWQKGSDSIGSLMPNSSIGGIGDVNTTFYIDGNSQLVSINYTGAEQGQRWGAGNSTNIKLNSSSQMGWLYITDQHAQQSSPAQGIHIFAQTNDTNLIHMKGWVGNMSTAEDVPIFA